MFHLTNKASIELDPANCAKVSVNERIDFTKVLDWVSNNMSYQNSPSQLVKLDHKKGKLEVKALNLRNGRPIGIVIEDSGDD